MHIHLKCILCHPSCDGGIDSDIDIMNAPRNNAVEERQFATTAAYRQPWISVPISPMRARPMLTLSLHLTQRLRRLRTSIIAGPLGDPLAIRGDFSTFDDQTRLAIFYRRFTLCKAMLANSLHRISGKIYNLVFADHNLLIHHSGSRAQPVPDVLHFCLIAPILRALKLFLVLSSSFLSFLRHQTTQRSGPPLPTSPPECRRVIDSRSKILSFPHTIHTFSEPGFCIDTSFV